MSNHGSVKKCLKLISDQQEKLVRKSCQCRKMDSTIAILRDYE